MTIRVADIVKKMDNIANPGLAENWDNPGLQVGSMDWEVKKIMITLDVTDEAVKKAVKDNIDLIISHHPLIFKALKKINDKNILTLIENRIAVFSAHTNLDVIKNGVNYALAKKIELQNVAFLSKDTGAKLYQVSVYVPKSHMDDIAKIIFQNGGGVIGDYSHCLNDYDVSGQFQPEKRSNPYLGEESVLEKVIERKLEFFVDSFNLDNVLSAMKRAHPYETPVFSVNLQEKKSENYGLGLIGDLKQEMTIVDFTEYVKKQLNAPFVKLWTAGKKDSYLISRVAICGGSGSSLIRKIGRRADIFVSGDFTYHTIIDSKLPLVDAGHFYTENPILDNIEGFLSEFEVEISRFSYAEHEINQLRIY